MVSNAAKAGKYLEKRIELPEKGWQRREKNRALRLGCKGKESKQECEHGSEKRDESAFGEAAAPGRTTSVEAGVSEDQARNHEAEDREGRAK